MIIRQPTREEYSEMVRIRDLSFLRPRPADERPAYTPEAGQRARCSLSTRLIRAALTKRVHLLLFAPLRCTRCAGAV